MASRNVLAGNISKTGNISLSDVSVCLHVTFLATRDQLESFVVLHINLTLHHAMPFNNTPAERNIYLLNIR